MLIVSRSRHRIDPRTNRRSAYGSQSDDHQTSGSLAGASAHAMRRSHQGIDVEHLLLSLLEQEPGLATSLLEAAGVSATAVKQAAEQALSKLPASARQRCKPGPIARDAASVTSADTRRTADDDPPRRVPQRGTCSLGDGRRRRRLSQTGVDQRSALIRSTAGARQSAGDEPGSRGHLSIIGKIWTRSDEAGRPRQIGSRHRTR